MSSGMSDYSDGSIVEDDFSDDQVSYADFDMDEDDVESQGTLDVEIIEEQRKPYEVEHSNVSAMELRCAQQNTADQIAALVAVSHAQALVLLRHFRWRKERLIDDLLEKHDETFQKVGLPVESFQAQIEHSTGFECPVCCDDDDPIETFALACAHRFCRFCYSRYIEEKVFGEGEVRRLVCMAGDCNMVLDEPSVQMLSNPETFRRYLELLDRAYVDDRDTIRWCPAPECDNAVRCSVVQPAQLAQTIPSVTCAAGHMFCFGCGLDEHQPCLCSIVKIWLKKCADDSETSNWISAHTKECPKCSSTIEKNGGCNHMTCRKCRYEFCWVCMGPWAEHGQSWYNCNRFEEKDSSAARDAQQKSRASLERYLHYFNRFDNHERSAKLDRELFARTERKMAELQNTSDMSWIEVQFLKNAVETLSACRRTLKWTYAFAFYLERSNATELFEDNQKDLEMAVEHLSELCEKPIIADQIARLKRDVLDRTVYVAKRREVFLTDTARGLAEERWTFHDSVPV
ncbi:hypothetical protein PYCC9005_003977 [Savitreella phatthalungensis]